MPLPLDQDHLDNMVTIDLIAIGRGVVGIRYKREFEDRCDHDDCTLPHRTRTATIQRDVDATPENLRRIADQLNTIATNRL